MKKLIKPKELIVYCCFALVFVLFAVLGNWDHSIATTIIPIPFIWIGNGIRYIGATSLAAAYVVYIVVGLTPLIFPIIRAAKTKKVIWRDIVWFILSAFIFVILYFFVNPHKIQYVLFQAVSDTLKASVRNITLLGFSITAYALLLFSLLCEALAKLNRNENKVYLYAKILFSVLIIGVLFNLLSVELHGTVYAIKNIPKSASIVDPVGEIEINRTLNIFAIVLTFIIKTIPAIFTILLFLQSKDFISSLHTDAFSKNNIPKLNAIIKTCKLTVFVSLGATILENIVYMLLSDKLLKAYYNLAVPMTMILAACLILIFSKILIKAILINEENKLVI